MLIEDVEYDGNVGNVGDTENVGVENVGSVGNAYVELAANPCNVAAVEDAGYVEELENVELVECEDA